VGRGGYKERVKEGDCGGNITYSCTKMEKGDVLKLSWERRVKE
jgi:hypothetical protein